MFQDIDDAIGLHEEVLIINVVDGYEAILFTRDGRKTIAEGRGDTVISALSDLERRIQNYKWKVGGYVSKS